MDRSAIPLVLASGSPRRLKLLRDAGFSPKVQIPGTPEVQISGESVEQLVSRLAREKARAIAETESVVVAGDTVVVLQGEILGKPNSPAHAEEMLNRLSGSSHRIVGGWCVCRGEEILYGVEACQVQFRDLSRSEISEYVQSGEPLDKAGGYGIQGGAGGFVSRFSGYWSNAIGLPLVPVTFSIEQLARR